MRAYTFPWEVPSLVFAALLFLVESWRWRIHLDDAYISYRYARNFAEGYGLVYNPGEYVEGFTNLLWTLLVALGVWSGWEAPEVGRVLGLCSGVALLAMAMLLAWALGARSPSLAFTPWVVLAWAPFVIWSTSGMETALYAAAICAALACDVLRRPCLCCLSLAVAFATRPVGVLAAVAIYGVRLFRGELRWREPLALVVVIMSFTVFRVGYYGKSTPQYVLRQGGGRAVDTRVHLRAGFSQVRCLVANCSRLVLGSAQWLRSTGCCLRVFERCLCSPSRR